MSRILQIFLASLLLVGFLGGCRKERAAAKRAAKFELVKPFTEVGAPVVVTVRASRKEITIADFLTLLVEVEAEKRCRAKMPELRDFDFGQFLVKDHYRLPARETKRGSQVQAIEFSLEPQLSGEYTIAPFSVSYVLEGELPDEKGNPRLHEIRTEPITISVKSLGAGDLQTAKLRDIKPPEEMPEVGKRRALFWLAAAGSALIGSAAVVLFLLRRRRKAIPPEKRVPPHIIAFEELRRLREMNLIEQGRIKEFYIAISNIMRFYVERRFGIHAPEQTTEEFLQAVSRDHTFDAPTSNRLKEFLSHCDLVKFAKHQPEVSEIQRTLDITRDFIEETKQEIP